MKLVKYLPTQDMDVMAGFDSSLNSVVHGMLVDWFVLPQLASPHAF